MSNYHKFRDKFVKVVTVACTICGERVLKIDGLVSASHLFTKFQFTCTKAMRQHMRFFHPEIKE